jgi:hypothetical protein
MKVIGMMCVRDEADLLPEVLEHLDGKLDGIYAYDDGSQDGTGNILLESPQVTYLMARTADRNRPIMDRPHYHHLLEKIKEDYDYENEDVWVVITMGDRFFLNKTPREIVAGAGEFPGVEGIQLDFLRHRLDPWTEENDTWPVYPESLRKICRGVSVDERCIVAYKVTNEVTYIDAKYPWPRAIGVPQYAKENMMGEHGKPLISLDMPFLEHQGRRSPKAVMDRIASGARRLGQKYKHYDLSTYESTVDCYRRTYSGYRLFPWVGLESLVPIVEWQNEIRFHDRVNQRWFFKGLEVAWGASPLPERTDI